MAHPRSYPFLGYGVGLRVPHYARALAGALEVDWVEVVSENFFGRGGRPRAVLEAVRRERPLVFHGVSLGVGSLGPPDAEYLERLRELADAFEPAWVSDHVCWTRYAGRQSHELLPLPFTEEALALSIENTQRAQDALRRPLVLENVSSYVGHAASALPEWEFLAELCRRSGCALLLDLNNVIVNAFNHGFSPEAYLAGLPPHAVVQLHLANHSQHPRHKFDDHRGPVPDAVWSLFARALRRFGPVSTLVEWDEDLPSWERLVAERDQAAERARRVLAEGAVAAPLHPHPPDDAVAPWAAPSPSASPPPSSLEATQRLFFRALTWPRGVRDFARAAGDGTRLELQRTFGGGTAPDPLERLDLYANAYFYRLLDAARATFPRLARLAGGAPFHDLMTDFVLECPSNAPDLRRLGERLPAFLRCHALGRARPLLPELAQLELALASALDAEDAEPLTRAELARLPLELWTSLALELVPSARPLWVLHDLASVVRRCDAGALEGADEAPVDEAPASEGLCLLVYRAGHAVHFRSASPLEALALESLRAGTRFGALCERLAQRGAEPQSLLGLLERWVDDGLLRAPSRLPV